MLAKDKYMEQQTVCEQAWGLVTVQADMAVGRAAPGAHTGAARLQLNQRHCKPEGGASPGPHQGPTSFCPGICLPPVAIHGTWTRPQLFFEIRH